MPDKLLNTQGVQYISVSAEYAGQRIDNFLVSRLKGLPKSRLYRLLRKGEVRVNKKRIKPDYRVQTGDAIRLPPIRLSESLPVSKPRTSQLMLLNERILYEDDSLIVLNKPAGMAVHGGSGVSLGVIEILRCARPQARFLELVHRLDRETSGCLLIAKKNSVLRELHALLRTKEIEKHYLALVKGRWPEQFTEINAPLRKNVLRSGERMVDVHREGKASLTLFKVLQHFKGASLVEASPMTGRTHQIRVHATHAGHPIAGDEKYGDQAFNQWAHQHGCKRLFLHAERIAFSLSQYAAPLRFSAPLDSELSECLEQLSV